MRFPKVINPFSAYQDQLKAGEWKIGPDPKGHPYKTDTRFQRRPDGQWVAKIPESNIQQLHRIDPDYSARGRRIAAKVKAQEKAMARIRRPIEARQAIGDPSCPANDNEDFPLLAVLRRDGLDAHIAIVKRYQRLVALCECEPLKGIDYSRTTGMNVEYRNKPLKGEEEVEAAANDNFKGGKVPGGEIEYRAEVKRSKGAFDIPPAMGMPTNGSDSDNPSSIRTAGYSMKFSEDLLISQIDAKPVLARIRDALGPLLDPFEDAVLGRMKFTEIGGKEGFPKRSSSDAGRALVFRALAAAAGAFMQEKHAA